LNYEELFEDSYARVIGEGVGIGDKGREFFSLFYRIFIDKSQQIRDRFADVDMDAQVVVLQKSMFHMISFYATKTATEYLENIARTHNRDQYAIKPEFYDIWLEALIETVAQLDPEYENDLALAWQLAMTPGIQFMKFQY
jgi:hemoglobin-like flavoprotein